MIDTETLRQIASGDYFLVSSVSEETVREMAAELVLLRGENEQGQDLPD